MNEEKETIEVSTSDVVDAPTIGQKIKRGAKKHRLIIFLSQFSFTLSLILFITLSCTAKGPFGPYNLNGWGLWWIFFLIMPVVPQLLLALRTRKLQLIPIDWLSIISFLLVGLLTGMWHPYWALLFIGPVFHLVVAPIHLN